MSRLEQPIGWHTLPNELKTLIASYLNYNDKCNLSLVDWQCRDLINNPLLWLGKTIVLKKSTSSHDSLWSTIKTRKCCRLELEDKACDPMTVQAITQLGLPITVLRLEYVDDDILPYLAQLTCITDLQLSNCSYIDHQLLIENFVHFNHLTKLALDAFNSLTDKTLYQLCLNCPQLTSLRLRYYHSPVPINCRQFTGIGIRKALAVLTHLQEIDFSFSILEDSQYVSDNKAWKSTFYLIFSPMRLKLHQHGKLEGYYYLLLLLHSIIVLSPFSKPQRWSYVLHTFGHTPCSSMIYPHPFILTKSSHAKTTVSTQHANFVAILRG